MRVIMSDKKYVFRFTSDEIEMLNNVVDELRSDERMEWDDEDKQMLEKINDQLAATRIKIMQRELKKNPMPPPAPWTDSSDEE